MVPGTCSRPCKEICTFYLKRKDTVIWGRVDESLVATKIISSLDVDEETIQRGILRNREPRSSL